MQNILIITLGMFIGFIFKSVDCEYVKMAMHNIEGGEHIQSLAGLTRQRPWACNAASYWPEACQLLHQSKPSFPTPTLCIYKDGPQFRKAQIRTVQLLVL